MHNMNKIILTLTFLCMPLVASANFLPYRATTDSQWSYNRPYPNWSDTFTSWILPNTAMPDFAVIVGGIAVSGLRPGTTAKVSPTTGDIARPENVVWLDTTNLALPQTKTQAIAAVLRHNDIRAALAASESVPGTASSTAYPALDSALYGTTAPPLVPFPATVPYNSGTTVYAMPGGLYADNIALNRKAYWGSYHAPADLYWTGGPPACGSTGGVIMFNASSYYSDGSARRWCGTLPVVVRSPSQWAAQVGDSSGNITNQSYKDEIDKMLMDKPNIVHWYSDSDLTKGLDGTSTTFNPALPSPSDVGTIMNPDGSLKAGSGAAANTAANTACVSAANSWGTAHANTVAAIIANSPADVIAALNQKEADALYIKDKCTADAAKTAADTTTASAPPASNNPASPGPVTAGTVKSVDLSPMTGLSGVISGKFPFTTLNQVGTLLNGLVTTPVAPVFHFPITSTQDMTIDLSPFNPIAVACRYLVSLLLTIGVIFYVVRRYIS